MSENELNNLELRAELKAIKGEALSGIVYYSVEASLSTHELDEEHTIHLLNNMVENSKKVYERSVRALADYRRFLNNE